MAIKAKHKNGEDDWSLIQRALQTGDEKAYASLFIRFKDSIYHTVFQMVRNTELAEDLMMEVFAKAFKNLGHYQPTHSFISWLNTIAKNHTLDHLRKKKPDSISLDATVETRPGRALLQVEDQEPDPEEEIEHEEMNKNIHLLVGLLKPHYKKLIELRYFEEHSYEDIAQELELPLGTVKAQLFRAKDLLYQIIKNKRDEI